MCVRINVQIVLIEIETKTRKMHFFTYFINFDLFGYINTFVKIVKIYICISEYVLRYSMNPHTSQI